MVVRSSFLTGAVAAGLALIPLAAHADVRIEERSSALESGVTRWIAIKGDKRTVVSKAETQGVLYHAGAKYGAYVEIARPDKEMIWELDPQERSYREVPAAKFTQLLQKGIQAPRNPNEQPLRSLYRSETTAIEVVPSGRTKRIAGFQAEEVVARAVIGAQNLVSGNKLVYTFDQQIWITKDPTLLKEVRPFEDAYIEHFGSAVTLAQARLMAGEWNDAFITHLRAVNDRVRALQGFPLSVTTTVTEQAVAQAKGEKGASRTLSVATTEVKKISVETVPDSEFELPAGYINEDTKVAIAPKVIPNRPAPPVVQVAKNDTPPAPQPVVKAPEMPVVVASVPKKEDAGSGQVASAKGAAAPATAGEVKPKPASDTVVAAAPQPMVAPAPQPVVAKVSPEHGTAVAQETPVSRPQVAKTTAPTRVAASQPVEQAPLPPFAFGGGAPTNVILPQGDSRKPSKSHKKGSAPAAAQPGAVLASAYPVYGSLTAPSAPSLVTVEEPELNSKKKKRH